MAGIKACGAYIPPRRMPLALLSGRAAKEGGPEKAVAWADEDSITMAVEAARSCLTDQQRDQIDLLIFVTTSYAYEEKQGAAIVAKALNLPANLRTLDVAHSLRSGTQALLAAVDAVKADSARQALVVIADCRMGAPGSALETNGGDAATAFLIAKDDVVAEISQSYSASNEMLDLWRRSGDRFVHNWEDRFVVQHGYLENTLAAVNAFHELGIEQSFDRTILSAADARSHKTLAAKLKVKEGLQSPLFGQVGAAGASHAPLQLVAALEQAAAGEKILLVNYGDGADVLGITVNQACSSNHFSRALDNRIAVKSLKQYQVARDLTIDEYQGNDFQGISATIHFRERDENLSLTGHVCSCGTHHFPKQRVCSRCGGIDQWQQDRCYAEQKGSIVTYTLDAFFPSPEPPTGVAIVQVDDGPRIYMQLTDIPAAEIKVGMSLEFVFRRIHLVGDRPNYFWKCRPVRGKS